MILQPWKYKTIKIIVPSLGWLKFPTKTIVFGEVPYSFNDRLGLLGARFMSGTSSSADTDRGMGFFGGLFNIIEDGAPTFLPEVPKREGACAK